MMRADLALSRTYPEKSRREWGRLLEEGLVTLNGRSLHKSTLVEPDAAFQFPADNPHLEWQLSYPGTPAEILFRDERIIAINKPAGLPSHPNSRLEHDSAAHRLVALLPDSANLREGFLLNRLDVGTSGILLSATNRQHLEELLPAFRAGSELDVRKTYLALVWGHPGFTSKTVDLPIAPGTRAGKRMVALPPGSALRHRGRARPASTKLELLSKGSYLGRPAALLRASLSHAMTHQVRVHLQAAGHPLLGDTVYTQETGGPAGGRPAGSALGLHCEGILVAPCPPCPPFPQGLDIRCPAPYEFTLLYSGW